MDSKKLGNLKVALVHDFLMQHGGAEQVLKEFAEIFPRATIYSIISDQKITDQLLPKRKIVNSFIQKLPFARKFYKIYLWLMPKAIESFDFSNYDLVLSDSSAFAKGIKTDKNKTLHVCYLHTPTRYLWGETDFYIKTAVPAFARLIVKLMIPGLRKWDLIASKRPDYIIANAQTISDRSKKYYNRPADIVIHPFADIDKFKQNKITNKGDYFLMANRLVAYKRNDIVIEAFNKLNLPLRVIGTGYSLPYLKSINKSANTVFLGRVNDQELIDNYQQCQAYIFPALEDFGITPIEAMSAGKPVIAYGEGGVTESVVEGETGLFFKQQNAQSVIEVIKKFKDYSFDPKKIVQRASLFSKERFDREIKEFLNRVINDNIKSKGE
jgi:glycosyltransferase involved in cell wall biosynthesis